MYQAPIVWLSAQLVVAPNLYLLGLFESRRFLNFFQAPYLQRLKFQLTREDRCFIWYVLLIWTFTFCKRKVDIVFAPKKN